MNWQFASAAYGVPGYSEFLEPGGFRRRSTFGERRPADIRARLRTPVEVAGSAR